jgi:hypothetical protein
VPVHSPQATPRLSPKICQAPGRVAHPLPGSRRRHRCRQPVHQLGRRLRVTGGLSARPGVCQDRRGVATSIGVRPSRLRLIVRKYLNANSAVCADSSAGRAFGTIGATGSVALRHITRQHPVETDAGLATLHLRLRISASNCSKVPRELRLPDDQSARAAISTRPSVPRTPLENTRHCATGAWLAPRPIAAPACGRGRTG